MPVSEELLGRLSELGQPFDSVREFVQSTVEASGESVARANEVVGDLEASVSAWLAATDIAERDLLAYLHGLNGTEDNADELGDDLNGAIDQLLDGDARAAAAAVADALGRLCGISMLHLAMANDVASLVPLDGGRPPDIPPGAPPTSMFDVAYGQVQLLESLKNDLAKLVDPLTDLGDTPELVVMRDVLERARTTSIAVCTHSVPHVGAAFHHVAGVLHHAAGVSPRDLQSTIRRIAGRVSKLVTKLFHRVRDVIDRVGAAFSGTLRSLMDRFAAHGRDTVQDGVVDHILGGIFGVRELELRVRVAQNRDGRMGDKARATELQDLRKANRRWVGPAEKVTHGFRFLAPVHLGPIPALAVAAGAVMVWTIILTGDQLDARGPFPNFWDGVGTIAER